MKSKSFLTFQVLLLSAALLCGDSVLAKAKTKPKRKGASVTDKTRNTVEKNTALDELKWVEGDERGNEMKALKAEIMVSRTEEKAIQQGLLLIKKYKGTAMEPGLQFRLAELYMRKSKTDRFFEIHRKSDTVVNLAPKLITNASSKAAIQKAINTYTYIEKQFPSFPQMDLVMFNHAFAAQAAGQEKDAEAIYWNLIRKFNSSALVPEAHLAIGEISFSRGLFTHALEHFNAVRKFPKSRVYPYGLYKAAWTHYNLRDAKAAMTKLEEVVSYGRMVTKNGVDSRLDLRKEALVDMTIFYEDVFPAKEAFKYFRAQAGDLDVGPSIVRLSEIYERHSRFDDQRELLTQFVEQLPENENMPEVYERLIQAHDHLKQVPQAVVRLENFSDVCKPGNRWLKAMANAKEDMAVKSEGCVKTLNTVALQLARKWLKAWKKTQKDDILAKASEKSFEIFLRTPGRGDDYAQARYAYAELLFQRGKYRQAAGEYAAVSAAGGNATLTHDAGYAAVLSLEKAVGEKWSNEDEATFHKLAENYVMQNPSGQYRLDIQFKMALLAYEKARYDEAAPMFLKLGKEFGNQPKGQKAQDLYLDILNIKKDYRGVRTYAQQLIKTTPEASRGDKLQKLYEGAYFLEIQTMEEKDQLRTALNEYLTFARQNPTSPLAEKATWNAMQMHVKMGDDFSAAKICEEFAEKFPKSDQAINALLKAAQTYEQMGQLGPAARVLSKLAEVDPKSRNKWRELAADFYTLDGQFNVGRKFYNDLRVGATGKTLVNLVTKIEGLEKTYGTPAAHNEALRYLIDLGVQPQSGEAKVAQIQKLYNTNNYTDAFNDARQMLGSSGLTSSQKAQVRYVQAQILEKEYLQQSVKARAERLATVLAIKTEKLDKAQEAFQSAIKFGDARVAVDSMEHLYNCYAHYVKALKEMASPAGLTAEDEKAFRAEIDKLIMPLEEKSADTLMQAVTFAKKQQFLDGTVNRLQSELNRVNMQTGISAAPDMKMPGIVVPLIAESGS